MAKKQMKSTTPRDAVKSSSPSPSTIPPRSDALSLLRADHVEAQRLFQEFENADSSARRRELAAQICKELTIHTTLEEEIFYPAAREALKDEDALLDEAEIEHAAAAVLIAQIQASMASDDKWEARVSVLGEYIEHHVKEEQKELFPKVRKGELDLKALGEQLLARKKELLLEQQRSRKNAPAEPVPSTYINAHSSP